MGRICEEFPALHPRTAQEEWDAAPDGWFEEIIEARAFAATKAQIDAAVKAGSKDMPDGPMAALVLQIEAAEQHG